MKFLPLFILITNFIFWIVLSFLFGKYHFPMTFGTVTTVSILIFTTLSLYELTKKKEK